MARIEPPAWIPPEQLFRNLLVLPRPKKLLNLRLIGAENIELWAHAISSEELHSCNGYLPLLFSKCLKLSNGSSAFTSPQRLIEIVPDKQYQKLMAEISQVLAEISPTLINIDYDKWMDRLLKGADHFSNYLIAHSLGSCFRITSLGSSYICQDEPEKYFGVPKRELIDCHYLAFKAAQRLYKSRNDI